MEATELYEQILGIEPPWFVKSVVVDEAALIVDVYLEHEAGPDWFPCPQCHQTVPVYDHLKARVWRHRDTCQYQTYLHASLPRVQCAPCGIRTVTVSWARAHSRFSLLFEAYALDVRSVTQGQSRAAQLLQVSPDQVRKLLTDGVTRGLQRRATTRVIPHVTLEEKSLCRGQHYVSVLCDGTQDTVLEVVEHRTPAAAEELLQQGLSASQRAAVQVVSLDLWAAYAGAVRAQLPEAAQVHDRFHLSGYLNDAVDSTRRAENKRLVRAGDEQLKGTRYLWLRSPATRTEKQSAQLDSFSASSLATVAVWRLKEAFRDFFTCATQAAATDFFQHWKTQVLALGNVHLTKVAHMFARHWAGLLAWVRYPVTNAIAESLKERIQQLKAKARGFRGAAGFRRTILFHLGKLDVYP